MDPTKFKKDIVLNLLKDKQCNNEIVIEFIKYSLKRNDYSVTLHPFGFLKFDFGKVEIDKEIYSIRIHIWNPLFKFKQNPSSFCHRHDWDLTSLVITGELVNKTYKFTYNNSEPEYAFYSIKYENNKSVSIRSNQIGKLDLIESKIVSKGSSYFISMNDFHNTEVNSSVYTATILVTYGLSTKLAGNLRPIESDKNIVFNRINLRIDCKRELQNLLLTLEKNIVC